MNREILVSEGSGGTAPDLGFPVHSNQLKKQSKIHSNTLII
jgi:hypothetical protein